MIDQARARRLRHARELAGFDTGTAAAEAKGWTYATYQGHENGSRGLRPDIIEKYATAFHVDARWLMTGQGQPARRSAVQGPPTPAPGFSDNDVTPFIARTATEGRAVEKAVELLAPQAKQPMLYQSRTGSPGFAILPGDILVIAQQPGGYTTGQVVVATLEGPHGEGSTVLRQTVGDALVAPWGYESPDDSRFAPGIMGAVVVVIRLPKSGP